MDTEMSAIPLIGCGQFFLNGAKSAKCMRWLQPELGQRSRGDPDFRTCLVISPFRVYYQWLRNGSQAPLQVITTSLPRVARRRRVAALPCLRSIGEIRKARLAQGLLISIY